ncbi:uncharacterized protein LOC121577410 [Coregonus clupeaformis]|uniref:uncharacterized protein LOC121577410 n=1 Tax=Coregonus clupeaformis TaxID=59861 RepID=UPI001E1C2FC2|nr:uncharacterized protein LOC121577410 [Coregonus clupeaformis]
MAYQKTTMAPGLTFRAFWICFLLFDGANCLPAQKGNPVLRKYPFRNIESNSYGGMPAPYGDASGLLNSGGFPRSGSDSGSAATSYQFSGGKPAPSFVSVQREPVPQSQELGQYTQLVSTPTKPKPMPSRLSLTKGGTVPSEYELRETVEQANYSSVYDDHVSSHSDSAQTRTSTEHEPNEIIPAPSDTFVQEPENASTGKDVQTPYNPLHERPALSSIVKDVSFATIHDLKQFVKSMRNSFLKLDIPFQTTFDTVQNEQVPSIQPPSQISKTSYVPIEQRLAQNGYSSTWGLREPVSTGSNQNEWVTTINLQPHEPLQSLSARTSVPDPLISIQDPASPSGYYGSKCPDSVPLYHSNKVPAGESVSKTYGSFSNAGSTFGNDGGAYNSFEAQSEQVSNVKQPFKVSKTGYAPTVQRPSPSSSSSGKDGQALSSNSGGYLSAPRLSPPRPSIPFPYPLGHGKTSPSEFTKAAQTGHVPIVRKPSLSRPFSVQGSPSSSDYVSTSKVNPAIQFPKPTSYQPGPRKMSPSVSEQRQQIPIEQGPKDVAYKPSSFHNADSTFGSYAGVSSSYNAQAEQVPNVQWPSEASQTGYAPIVQKPSHSSPGQGGPYRTGGYVSDPKVSPPSQSILFPKPTNYQSSGHSVSEQQNKVPINRTLKPKDMTSRPSVQLPASSGFGDYEAASSSFDAPNDKVPNAQQPNKVSQTGYVFSVPRPAPSNPSGLDRQGFSSQSILFTKLTSKQPLGQGKTSPISEQQVNVPISKKPKYVTSRPSVQRPASSGFGDYEAASSSFDAPNDKVPNAQQPNKVSQTGYIFSVPRTAPSTSSGLDRQGFSSQSILFTKLTSKQPLGQGKTSPVSEQQVNVPISKKPKYVTSRPSVQRPASSGFENYEAASSSFDAPNDKVPNAQQPNKVSQTGYVFSVPRPAPSNPSGLDRQGFSSQSILFTKLTSKQPLGQGEDFSRL